MIAVAIIFVVVKQIHTFLLYAVFCFVYQIIQIWLSMKDQTPTEKEGF